MEIDEMALGQEETAPDASQQDGAAEEQITEADSVEQAESPSLATEGEGDTAVEEAQNAQAESTMQAEVTDAAVASAGPAEPTELPETDTNQTQIEETTDAPSSDANAHPMEALLEEDFSVQPLKRGEIVEGSIVRASRSEILIDVGGKTEGVVPARELDRMDDETLSGLEVGGTVMVYVVTPEDRNGNILVSLDRAREEQDWIEAERYLSEGEAYEGTISGFNKGGLIVHFGQLRGFVPASQVSIDRRRASVGNTPEERWGDMMHEPITVKMVEVDRGRNRLILSERAASRESRAARKTALLDKLEVGQVVNGRVISLTDFGAFVDVGGADGLVHLSELSWGHVTHPKEVVSIGDKVEVEIINLDRENQRIGLSLKRRLKDPWLEMAEDYEVGQLVQGTVTKLTKFGAFARLVDAPEIEGLIHISELADRRVGHPRDVVDEGEVLTLRIVRIEPDKRRIGLSLKRVDSEAFLDSDWQAMIDSVNADEETEEEVEGGAQESEPADAPTAEAEVEAATEADDELVEEAEGGAQESEPADAPTAEVEVEAAMEATDEPEADLEPEPDSGTEEAADQE